MANKEMTKDDMHYSGRFFTTEELAARWAPMKPETLEIWRQRKKGPQWVRLEDGTRPPIRYPVEAVDAWERDHTMPTAGDSQ